MLFELLTAVEESYHCTFLRLEALFLTICAKLFLLLSYVFVLVAALTARDGASPETSYSAALQLLAVPQRPVDYEHPKTGVTSSGLDRFLCPRAADSSDLRVARAAYPARRVGLSHSCNGRLIRFQQN